MEIKPLDLALGAFVVFVPSLLIRIMGKNPFDVGMRVAPCGVRKFQHVSLDARSGDVEVLEVEEDFQGTRILWRLLHAD